MEEPKLNEESVMSNDDCFNAIVKILSGHSFWECKEIVKDVLHQIEINAIYIHREGEERILFH